MQLRESFPDFIVSYIDLLRDHAVITDHLRELSDWGAALTPRTSILQNVRVYNYF